MNPVQQEIINAIDKRNLNLLNNTYPKLKRIGLWLGVIAPMVAILANIPTIVDFLSKLY